MVDKYKTVPIATRYWRPGEDYLQQIVNNIKKKVEDGDIVTVSEKAISVAKGNIIDESKINPGSLAMFLARYWMRVIWGCVLGSLSRLRKRTIQRLRAYPVEDGSAHKQVALENAGFLQALMFGSEGGIDASNLPYSYVSLPLRNAQQIAREIHEHIKSRLGDNAVIMIIDTDKTYSLRGFHFTPRPGPISGIHSLGGFVAYVVGRFFRLKRRATPIAMTGSEMRVEEALEVAEFANRAQGHGAGRTVWDMAETFKVPITRVTWDMLDRVVHKPIVIVKKEND